ncbi:hypothetical protein C8R43DRAFT_1136893 [Mycena crocata]|nr:hypothetical protein C8R43DRAFT_1136893 [Mycena crocata]
MAGRRTLRSGKEFSEYDLGLSRAILPPVDFDIGNCLEQRLAEQDTCDTDEEEDLHASDALSATEQPTFAAYDDPASPASPLPPAERVLSAKQRNNLKSRARRDKQRVATRAASSHPYLKAVNLKRVNQAKSSALETDIDSAALPHSKPAWVGDRWAARDEFDFEEPKPPHDLSTGLGNTMYTQDQVDALSGTEGFMYIDWLGELTIPILDKHRRVVAVLGGKPKDLAGWQEVTDGASKLLQERLARIRLSPERLQHRRAQEEFAALARGWSHGGGQTEPGELVNNVANTQLTDELLAHVYFQRLAGFANMLFAMWAPMLFAFYQAQMALLAAWKPSMRPNFVCSVFAACTFNFGPRAVTAPHIDFANLAWGWCVITALGLFDPDLGGHLILWDLRLVIRFPPGSTILLPSALIRHSNVPIREHEHRSSFVQYTAGGLFRWVRNGFQTDESFELSASAEELAAREEEKQTRWKRGMEMFSVIDDL